MASKKYTSIAQGMMAGKSGEPTIDYMEARHKKLMMKPGKKKMGGYLDFIFAKRMERQNMMNDIED